MKKYLVIFCLVFVLLIALVGCDSKKSSATDEEVNEWKQSSDAYDIDQNGQIDAADYELYKAYLDWKSGDDSRDYNLDRKIDIKDFVIEVGYKSWKNSNDAFDYDDDQKITWDDYLVQVEINEWKRTPAGKDFNKDGTVDYYDYLQYDENIKLVGQYKINITNTTNNMYFFEEDGKDLYDIMHDGFLGHITFEYTTSCDINVTIDETGKAYIGNHLNDLMQIANTLDMQRYSSFVNVVTFRYQTNNVSITPVIYFQRPDTSSTTFTGTLSFRFINEDIEVQVTFALYKIA